MPEAIFAAAPSQLVNERPGQPPWQGLATQDLIYEELEDSTNLISQWPVLGQMLFPGCNFGANFALLANERPASCKTTFLLTSFSILSSVMTRNRVLQWGLQDLCCLHVPCHEQNQFSILLTLWRFAWLKSAVQVLLTKLSRENAMRSFRKTWLRST